MLTRHPLELGLMAVCLLGGFAVSGFAQRVYSYLDENGVRVYTNIPPKNLQTSEMSSTPITAQAASKGSAKREGSNGNSAPEGKGAGLTAGGYPEIPPSYLKPEDTVRGKFDSIIEKYAGQYRLDPDLVRSMISRESAFNARAVSNKGAQGLMQLMPATASRLGVRDPFDPEENIRGGTEHLRFLLDTFKNDLPLSLAAYNAGENLVQRIQRIPNFPETRAYVRNITSRYGRNEMVPQPSGHVQRTPSTFRYKDDRGIWHFTNIAPTQQPETEFVGWAITGQSPE
jgi:soluble lytic murein transglycosylase